MTNRLLRIPVTQARSSSAAVAQVVGTSVIAGLFAAESRLPPEPELLARFSVSRPVLREGLRLLAGKGLVSIRPGAGAVVQQRSCWNMFDADVLAWQLEAGVDLRFLLDLAEIRLAVEPESARLAARRRGSADMIEIRESLSRMRRETSDTAGFAEADLSLHLAIGTASGNPFMRSIGKVIEAALLASVRLTTTFEPVQFDAVVAAHQRIVDAIEVGDGALAASAMAAVINAGIDRMCMTGATDTAYVHLSRGQKLT